MFFASWACLGPGRIASAAPCAPGACGGFDLDLTVAELMASS